MATQTTKNKTNLAKKDTLETGIFDQFFGDYDTPDYRDYGQEFGFKKESKTSPKKAKREFSLFNYQEYYERELVKKQIKELTQLIKNEIELIKKADASLLNEVKEVQRVTMESLPQKPGIYHVRFLELILSVLRTVRAKIGESKTWLQALMSKKKKRGSLFLVRSKKQGTQYSLSQELQSARSVQ